MSKSATHAVVRFCARKSRRVCELNPNISWKEYVIIPISKYVDLENLLYMLMANKNYNDRRKGSPSAAIYAASNLKKKLKK